MTNPCKPCVKCGATERYANGKCRPCVSNYNAKHHAANPNKTRESKARHSAANAKYYAKNTERISERNAIWCAANPEKVSARKAKWRAANVEKVRASSAAWRAANPEKHRAAAAACHAANPGRKRASEAAWRAANPEKCCINNQNRRARKQENGGQLSHGLAEKLFKLQRGKCACGCKQPLGDDYHRDHIMPLALGGSNTDDNMQLLRKTCNLQKSAKHPVDFAQQRGLLI